MRILRRPLAVGQSPRTTPPMHLQLDEIGTKYDQLARALKHAILSGQIAAGAKLPSTRMLSETLHLSCNTVLKAYELLVFERLGVAREGSGTYVCKVSKTRTQSVAARSISPQSRYAARLRQLGPITLSSGKSDLRYDLQYGAPLPNPKLISAWGRALGQAASRSEASYPDSQGLSELRELICAFLATWRGVMANPEDVVIVSGAQQALSLAARVLLDEGDVAAVEDPHYQMAVHCLRAHGAELFGVRVDGAGLVVDELPASTRFVHVTPSHQFPSGSSMSLPRRLELLRFAEQHSAWIFEDDYDGEISYSAKPLPALRSLDRGDRVVYCGSFSKVMFPSLRLGYLVCPKGLRKDLVAAKRMDDLGSAAIEQAAMHAMFDRGTFERHLRATVAELRKRRRALLEGLACHANEYIRARDSEFGMHVVGWLPAFDQKRLDCLIAMGRTRGLGLHSIHSHYSIPPEYPGLLLGFAGLSPRQINAATRLLGECLRDLDRSTPG